MPNPCASSAIKSVALFLCLALSAPTAAETPTIGEVTFSKGVSTAQNEGQQARFLGKGFPLYEGDVVSTGKRSFTILKLSDGTKMTLRPNTVFGLQEFSEEKESATLKLFKGGLRALTGLLSKKKPDAFKIDTPLATIGIRGTVFDVRLCEGDCDADSQNADSGGAVVNTPVVARVALVTGTLEATNQEGIVRKVVRGGPIYEKELLETRKRSFAVLAFQDETRVTMRPNTQFQVEEFSPEPYAEAEERVLLKLFKGGLRALTGLIAKKSPNNFKIATPLATIGIRGTGFDLSCTGDCVSADADLQAFIGSGSGESTPQCNTAPQSAAEASVDAGLYAFVWDGSVNVETEDCQLTVDQGETYLFKPGETQASSFSEVPDFMKDESPRPDQVDVDQENFFGTGASEESGLFVVVQDGHVSIITEGEVLDLGGGEAGFVNPNSGEPARLGQTPGFMEFDAVPAPGDVDPALMSLLDFFGDDVEGNIVEPLACTID